MLWTELWLIWSHSGTKSAADVGDEAHFGPNKHAHTHTLILLSSSTQASLFPCQCCRPASQHINRSPFTATPPSTHHTELFSKTYKKKTNKKNTHGCMKEQRPEGFSHFKHVYFGTFLPQFQDRNPRRPTHVDQMFITSEHTSLPARSCVMRAGVAASRTTPQKTILTPNLRKWLPKPEVYGKVYRLTQKRRVWFAWAHKSRPVNMDVFYTSWLSCKIYLLEQQQPKKLFNFLSQLHISKITTYAGTSMYVNLFNWVPALKKLSCISLNCCTQAHSVVLVLQHRLVFIF